MTSARLQSFSDGVLAIIITITVLGVRVPVGESFSSFLPLLPLLAIYAWSFELIGTYWNSHHYLFKVVKEVNSRILWANLLLLFWLSLVPLATEWLGENINTTWPTAFYCFILLAAAVSFTILTRAITAHERNYLHVTSLIAGDWRRSVSIPLYLLSVVFAFIYPLVSYAFVVAVAVIWFIPEGHSHTHEPREL
jgi:uncharacterized membrane protein